MASCWFLMHSSWSCDPQKKTAWKTVAAGRVLLGRQWQQATPTRVGARPRGAAEPVGRMASDQAGLMPFWCGVAEAISNAHARQQALTLPASIADCSAAPRRWGSSLSSCPVLAASATVFKGPFKSMVAACGRLTGALMTFVWARQGNASGDAWRWAIFVEVSPHGIPDFRGACTTPLLRRTQSRQQLSLN